MPKLNEMLEHLNQYLQVQDIRDYCPKGLVVEGKQELKKGVAAVSFSLDIAQRAVEAGADFILVHHPNGFWDSQKSLPIGPHRKKLKLLLENDISLIGYHLPLDAHPEVGNNVQILKALNLFETGPFMLEGRVSIGRMAEPAGEELSIQNLIQRVEKGIGPVVHSFCFGPETITSIAVCSGGAPNSIEEAAERGAQVYLTGEARENTREMARELGIHYLAAGHHRTEVFGPKALAGYISEQFGLEMEFLDTENPV